MPGEHALGWAYCGSSLPGSDGRITFSKRRSARSLAGRYRACSTLQRYLTKGCQTAVKRVSHACIRALRSSMVMTCHKRTYQAAIGGASNFFQYCAISCLAAPSMCSAMIQVGDVVLGHSRMLMIHIKTYLHILCIRPG